MTTTSKGYDGTVLESDWAHMIPYVGSPYTVVGPTDLRVVAGGSGAQAVTVAAGSASGSGILDVFSTSTVLNAGSLSSGVRWDTVVINRIWSSNTSSLIIRAGTSAQQVSSAIVHNPGIEDDQVLALIRIDGGNANIGAVIDLRTFAGKSLILPSDPSLINYAPPSPIGQIGYTVDGHLWRAEDNGSGVGVWVDKSKPVWTLIILPGSTTPASVAPAFCKIGGIVRLRGAWLPVSGTFFSGGGTGGQYSLGTLPPGFRPGATMSYEVDHGMNGTSINVRLTITTGGVITALIQGDTSSVGSAGVSFVAEN